MWRRETPRRVSSQRPKASSDTPSPLGGGPVPRRSPGPAGSISAASTLAPVADDVQYEVMFNENEHGTFLNEPPLLAEARQQLNQHGIRSQVTSSRPDDVDGRIRLIAPSGRTHTYLFQLKQRIGSEQATALHAPLNRDLLVVAPYIGEPAAEVLRRRGVDYVDAAGNAHLSWGDVLIDVRGRRKSIAPDYGPSPRGGRAFRPAGLKVQFILLSWPSMAPRPLRDLSRASGVSLGTAKTVVDELTNAGYLVAGKTGRRLVRGKDLLNRWSEAYSIALAPTLVLQNFFATDLSWWQQSREQLVELGVQVGGEAGASILDPRLRPSSLTLYGEQVPLQLVAKYRMVREGKDYNVHFRRRFWRVPDDVWVVPSPLIYADLIASGDPRQREHADRLRGTDDRLTRIDRS